MTETIGAEMKPARSFARTVAELRRRQTCGLHVVQERQGDLVRRAGLERCG